MPPDQQTIPTASPTVTPTQTPTPPPLYTPARLPLRFLNFVLDRILVFAYSIIGTIALIVGYALLSRNNLVAGDLITIPVVIALYIICLFLYYFASEQIFGRTPAKFLTKTQVVGIHGKATTYQLLIRTFARLIPFDEYSILFSKRRAWHDSLSDTWVVETSKLPENLRISSLKDKILTPITALFLVGCLGLVFVLPVYEKFTGGERIDLPKKFPNDFVITNLRQETYGERRYFLMEFEGKNRKIQINRLIAGFNYDPDEPCVYMRPTKQNYTYEKISEFINCTEIEKLNTYDGRPFRVTYTGKINAKPSYYPDYYITDPPYRLAIKVLQGNLTEQEVLDMAKSNLKTYLEQDLKNNYGKQGYLSN